MQASGQYFLPRTEGLKNSQREGVLIAIRELLSLRTEAAAEGPEALAIELAAQRLLPYLPDTFDVEAALEPLDVERGAA